MLHAWKSTSVMRGTRGGAAQDLNPAASRSMPAHVVDRLQQRTYSKSSPPPHGKSFDKSLRHGLPPAVSTLSHVVAALWFLYYGGRQNPGFQGDVSANVFRRKSEEEGAAVPQKQTPGSMTTH